MPKGSTPNVVTASMDVSGEDFMAATPETIAKATAKSGRPAKVLSPDILAKVRAAIAANGAIAGGRLWTATDADVTAANEKRNDRANGAKDAYTVDTLSADMARKHAGAYKPYVEEIAKETGKVAGLSVANEGTAEAPAYRWVLRIVSPRQRRSNPKDGAAE